MKDLATSIVKGFDARERKGPSETLWNIRAGKHTVAEVISRKSFTRVNFRDLPANLPDGIEPMKEAGNRKPGSRWACGIAVKAAADVAKVRQLIDAATKEPEAKATTKPKAEVKKSSSKRARNHSRKGQAAKVA